MQLVERRGVSQLQSFVVWAQSFQHPSILLVWGLVLALRRAKALCQTVGLAIG